MHPGLFLVLLILTAAGCNAPSPELETEPDDAPVVLGAENVYTVIEETLQSGPRISGSLQAKRQTVVRAEVGGAVVSVAVEIGDTVTPRQIIARIETSALDDGLLSAESGVTSARVELETARRQAERVEKLVKAGALSSRDLELAQNAVTSNEARLKDAAARLASAQKQLNSTSVRAPIAGVVATKSVNTGDIVSLGAPLISVIDPSSMRLEASVPSDHLDALSIGSPVEFEVRGYRGQTFTGSIERIAPAADPVTRQISILVAIPNPGGKLIAGLFAEGRVASLQQQALSIPMASLEQIGKSSMVRRIQGGVVEQIPVTVGIQDDRREKVQIIQGLAAGDTILLNSARGIPVGTKVSLRGEQAKR